MGGEPFVLGIDLGTTHTALAWSDGKSAPRVFPIPQQVSPQETQALPLLPSVLYAPLPDELSSETEPSRPFLLGSYAQRRASEVPGRSVASWKSWLCHGGIDRRAPLLPWGNDDPTCPKISPVDAAQEVLAHVQSAWNSAFPQHPLADQEVVLTVPASFDELARELTVEAARRAGFEVTLLEEPQAAFYHWLHRVGPQGAASLLDGLGEDGLVLVCDVGGGTTDLSLMRTSTTPSGERTLERMAVGPHLLLGGDNMDLALAHASEPRMVAPGQHLSPGRFAQLVAACKQAKEVLLGQDSPEEFPLRLLGSGSKLVGTTLKTSLHRDEAEALVLDAFFPPLARHDATPPPRGALTALGLPYERDIVIPRHVARFLNRHAPGQVLPKAILFNGGVFRAKRVEDRLLQVIESWGSGSIARLSNDEPDLAVACGAVAFGLARRGRGLRIQSGTPRNYFLGLRTAHGSNQGVCILPKGTLEGAVHRLAEPPLALVMGKPVRFDLFSSDEGPPVPSGTVVDLQDDAFQRLPPVTTVFGKAHGGKSSQELPVVLEGELSPIGTLELAAVERAPKGSVAPRRFRLSFQLHDGTAETKPLDAHATAKTVTANSVTANSVTANSVTANSVTAKAGLPLNPDTSKPSRDHRLHQALERVASAYNAPDDTLALRSVKDLLRDLERALGERPQWTVEVNRALFDALLPLRQARRRSADHERVYWLLAGYCLRPGFGFPGDDERTRIFFGLFREKIVFPDNPRAWQAFWNAWRRCAGGMSERMQGEIRDAIDPFLAPAEAGLKRSKKWKVDAEEELWAMAAHLERVPATRKEPLGDWIVERALSRQDPRLWALVARLGARVPAYASAHQVVSPAAAERWLHAFLKLSWDKLPHAVDWAVALGRRTDDRARDIDARTTRDVLRKLQQANAPSVALRALEVPLPLEATDQWAPWGDDLPVGLKLLL